MREYGRCADGREILAPSGWKLLPEGEAVPSFHREAKEDGTWCSPRRCRSTMTPLFACVSGYVRAFAVPEAYSIIPAGATDFVTDQFASEFGRTLLRVTYFQRLGNAGVEKALVWTGSEWKCATRRSWAGVKSIDEHRAFAGEMHPAAV